MTVQLELSDIQGTVLRNRPMPYFGAYLIFRIGHSDEARVLLSRLIPYITSAADWDQPAEDAWINVVVTHEGLRHLGVDESILAGFPVEFRQGMAARKQILGDVGESDPDRWDLPHGGTGFHLGLLVMAGSAPLRDEKLAIGHAAITGLNGVTLIAQLDVGVPPTMREHFGFVDGISRPFIEGEGGSPLPGQGEPTKAGEFLLGYPNEMGMIATGPGPEEFWRNGTYIAIRKIYQNVAAFRKFLRDNNDTPEGQEFIAAKMMGRWRSGCPLALSPHSDNPELAPDKLRNNDFAYYDDDLVGQKTPVGCHIRRVNPRDGLKDTIAQARLHRLLRRGSAYGPMLADDATEDDGADRGIVLALINANPGRQFEFVQSQWVNDGDFVSQGSRSDPIVGRRDVANDYVFPARPVRRRLTGLRDFTVIRGGEHVFLPGVRGLQWLTKTTGRVTNGQGEQQ